MPSVADLISPEQIKKLAIPSNIRLGTVIAKEGIVEFIELSPTEVVAKVIDPKGSSKRTVILKSTSNGLEYKCSCSNKLDWFCKHCVATSILIPKLK